MCLDPVAALATTRSFRAARKMACRTSKWPRPGSAATSGEPRRIPGNRSLARLDRNTHVTFEAPDGPRKPTHSPDASDAIQGQSTRPRPECALMCGNRGARLDLQPSGSALTFGSCMAWSSGSVAARAENQPNQCSANNVLPSRQKMGHSSRCRGRCQRPAIPFPGL